MQSSRNSVIEKVSTLPDDMLESVINFVDYLDYIKSTLTKLESQYSSFDRLKSSILHEEHTWKEETDFARWEAAKTELERIKQILKSESEG